MLTVSDLLFWNTLADSVDWLNKEKQAKQFTPKSLIQTILDNSEIAEEPYSPTIIKTILPRETNLAPVILFPKQGDIGEFEKHINAHMTREYGALHGEDAVYSGPKFRAAAIPLYPSQLRQLILYGTVEISSIQQGQIAGCRKLRENECLFILPVGTDHVTTIETCGIGRDDLLELLEKLRKQEPITPKANEVKEADEGQPAAVESTKSQTETKASQVSATLTEQLKDDELASLFDGVAKEQLAALFKVNVKDEDDLKLWSMYLREANKNKLKNARVSRGRYNPYKAGHWWLNTKKPIGWTPEKLNKKLAKSLPERSKGNESRLTGEDFE